MAAEIQRKRTSMARREQRISDSGSALTRPSITWLRLTSAECRFLATRQKSMNYTLYTSSVDRAIEQCHACTRTAGGDNTKGACSTQGRAKLWTGNDENRVGDSKLKWARSHLPANGASRAGRPTPCMLMTPPQTTTPPRTSSCCSVVRGRIDRSSRDSRCASLHEQSSPSPWLSDPPVKSMDDYCLERLQSSGFLTSRKTTLSRAKYDARAWAIYKNSTLQTKGQTNPTFPPNPPVSLFGRPCIAKKEWTASPNNCVLHECRGSGAICWRQGSKRG